MYGFRHERIDHGKRFANGKVYINRIEGFWSYAKERLLKFHGVRRENFVYYIRWNILSNHQTLKRFFEKIKMG
jgi:transposase